jgi:hypothetical protein
MGKDLLDWWAANWVQVSSIFCLIGLPLSLILFVGQFIWGPSIQNWWAGRSRQSALNRIARLRQKKDSIFQYHSNPLLLNNHISMRVVSCCGLIGVSAMFMMTYILVFSMSFGREPRIDRGVAESILLLFGIISILSGEWSAVVALETYKDHKDSRDYESYAKRIDEEVDKLMKKVGITE